MFPKIFCLGRLCIYSYGVMVFLAILSGFLILKKTAAGKISKSRLEDMVFFTVLWGIIGARIFYFFFWDFESVLKNPLSFFYIWQGGLAVFGGFIGGAGVLFFYSRKLKMPFLKLLDFFSPAFALGQSIGRIGCFLAGCCYGKPTSVFFGVRFMNPHTLAPPGVKIYPTQLMECVLDFVLFLFLLKTKKEKDGDVFAFYLLGYPAIRFFLEFLRGDAVSGMFGLTAIQNIAMIGVISGLALKLWTRRPDRE